MDFSPRASTVNLSVKGLDNKPVPEDLYVEIVLIDKSNELMRPVLYQFRSDLYYHNHRNHSDAIDKNSFVLLGEVDTIDKKKKQVYLTNYRTITYRYLITASGLQQTSFGDVHDADLSAGVVALWEALRVRSNCFPPLTTEYQFDDPAPSLPPVTKKNQEIEENMNKIDMSKAIASSNTKQASLSSPEKRLYELQL